MNGWQRLGVVLGAILSVPAGLVAIDVNKWANISHDPSPRVAALSGPEWAAAVYTEAIKDNRRLRGCIPKTLLVSREPYGGQKAIITCERNLSNALFDSIPWVLLPFLAVFGFGYTVQWVYRGFRPSRA